MADRVFVWRYLGKPRSIVAPDIATATAGFLRNCGPDVKEPPKGAEYLGAHTRQAYRRAWSEWVTAGRPANMEAFRNG